MKQASEYFAIQIRTIHLSHKCIALHAVYVSICICIQNASASDARSNDSAIPSNKSGSELDV